jgi:uncharacterized membrane protein
MIQSPLHAAKITCEEPKMLKPEPPLGRFSWAEVFLIVVVLACGLAIAWLTPIGGGTDEETHVLRAWDMGEMYLIPNQVPRSENPFPMIYWRLSYRRLALVRPIGQNFFELYKDYSLESMGYITDLLETRSVYSPPLLLPQALVMRFGADTFRLPALQIYFLARVGGLLAYLGLAWLAVRLIPFGKWPLAVLAVSPSILFHAATVNTDAISNGLGLLFIAGSLYIASLPLIRWREVAALGLLFFFLFLGKVNLVTLALLPFLLIPLSRFRSRSHYAAALALAAGMFLVVMVGWNVVAYSQYTGALEGAGPGAQVRYILSHPLAFPGAVLADLGRNGLEYLRDWAAMFGYAYWPVPAVTYPLYGLALLAAVLIPDPARPDRRTRLVLLFLFGLGYLATVGSLYVSYTPVGSPYISGVQGRYFSLVMPLLILALAGLPLLRGRWPVLLTRWAAPAAGALAVLSFTLAVYFVYHITCGASVYRTGLCLLPVYKNWAPNERYSPPISAGFSLEQEIIPECNGLAEVRVWLDRANADPDGQTIFTLKDEERGLLLFQESIPNRSLPEKAWHRLEFEPDWSSYGQTLLLNLRAAAPDPDRGVRVSYSLRPEYPEGALYVNGEEVEQDVIFRYGCVVALEKRLRALLP